MLETVIGLPVIFITVYVPVVRVVKGSKGGNSLTVPSGTAVGPVSTGTEGVTGMDKGGSVETTGTLVGVGVGVFVGIGVGVFVDVDSGVFVGVFVVPTGVFFVEMGVGVTTVVGGVVVAGGVREGVTTVGGTAVVAVGLTMVG